MLLWHILYGHVTAEAMLYEKDCLFIISRKMLMHDNTLSRRLAWLHYAGHSLFTGIALRINESDARNAAYAMFIRAAISHDIFPLHFASS